MTTNKLFNHASKDLSDQEKRDKKTLLINHHFWDQHIGKNVDLSEETKSLLKADTDNGLSLFQFKLVTQKHMVERATSKELTPLLKLYHALPHYQKTGEDIEKGLSNYVTKLDITSQQDTSVNASMTIRK